VLSGATVEVSSPALIKKSPSGGHRRPGARQHHRAADGICTIRLTLTDVNTVRREEIEVTVGAAVPILDHLNDIAIRPDLDHVLPAGNVCSEPHGNRPHIEAL
jgi:hypothetical protein